MFIESVCISKLCASLLNILFSMAVFICFLLIPYDILNMQRPLPLFLSYNGKPFRVSGLMFCLYKTQNNNLQQQIIIIVKNLLLSIGPIVSKDMQGICGKN